MTKDPISPTDPTETDPVKPRTQKTTAGSNRSKLSRRTFLRYSSLGVAGTALLLSRTVDTFAANLLTSRQPQQRPPGLTTPSATQPDAEVGEVMLDGLMMTYFTSHPAFASSVFTFGKNFSTTFTLKLPRAPGIALTGTVGTDAPALAQNHSQEASSWIKDAMILGSSAGATANQASRQFSKEGGSDPVQIYGLRNPRLRFSGSPDGLRFCVSDLGQRSFNLHRDVSTATATSMYAQYITDPAALFPPRFYWMDVVGADGKTAFDFVLPRKIVVRNGITATVTAKIMDQTGFRSDTLRDAFAPGNDIEITYHSAQELYSTSLMDLQTTPLEPETRIYIDRVFKTFLMTERPASS